MKTSTAAGELRCNRQGDSNLETPMYYPMYVQVYTCTCVTEADMFFFFFFFFSFTSRLVLVCTERQDRPTQPMFGCAFEFVLGEDMDIVAKSNVLRSSAFCSWPSTVGTVTSVQWHSCSLVPGPESPFHVTTKAAGYSRSLMRTTTYDATRHHRNSQANSKSLLQP